MLILNEYGKKIQKDFEEYCRTRGVWEDMFEEGTYVLEDAIRGIKDCTAWHLITYSEDAIDTVQEWEEESETGVAWSTNWSDLTNAFNITYVDLINELNKCFTEVRESMTIKLTLNGKEIEQLEKIAGCDILDEATLHNVVMLELKKYMEV
jgi:hypothetical protein